jgi:hypothetical protein
MERASDRMLWASLYFLLVRQRHFVIFGVTG